MRRRSINPGKPAREFAAEKNVLRDVEIGDEREVLENDGNAEFAGGGGIMDGTGFAVMKNEP